MFRTGCFSMCIDFGLKIDLYKNNINRSTLRTGSVHAGVPSTRLYMLNLLGHTFCKKSISLLFIIIILKLYNLICYSLASLIEKHSFLLLIKKQQNLVTFHLSFFSFFFSSIVPLYLVLFKTYHYQTYRNHSHQKNHHLLLIDEILLPFLVLLCHLHLANFRRQPQLN